MDPNLAFDGFFGAFVACAVVGTYLAATFRKDHGLLRGLILGLCGTLFVTLGINLLGATVLFTVMPLAGKSPNPLRTVGTATGAIMVGGALYLLRYYQRLYYGLLELVAAIATIMLVSAATQAGAEQRALTLLGAIYFLVRGLDNIVQGRSQRSHEVSPPAIPQNGPEKG